MELTILSNIKYITYTYLCVLLKSYKTIAPYWTNYYLTTNRVNNRSFKFKISSIHPKTKNYVIYFVLFSNKTCARRNLIYLDYLPPRCLWSASNSNETLKRLVPPTSLTKNT